MAEYIDRDGYIKSQRELCCKNCPKRDGMRNGKKQKLYPIGGVVCRACELNDALNALEDFPAADVAPVKRGKWMNGRKCSVCGFDWMDWFYEWEIRYSRTDYCPNCGARMEGAE